MRQEFSPQIFEDEFGEANERAIRHKAHFLQSNIIKKIAERNEAEENLGKKLGFLQRQQLKNELNEIQDEIEDLFVVLYNLKKIATTKNIDLPVLEDLK